MKTRQAFTLVELLTVIVIIGILATLITVAVSAALRAAKRGKISMEMGQIVMALDRYKAEIGEYPPDGFDSDALVRHVKKRWPRLDFSLKPGGISDAEYIIGAINTGYGNNVDFTVSGSGIGSLAFWLGGFPNTDGTLSGFNADPENPFFSNPVVPLADRVYDKKSFIDMELGNDKSVRLVDVGGGARAPAIGNEIQGMFVPFVYFKGKADGGDAAYKDHNGAIKQFVFADWGTCVPYAEEEDGTVRKWKNPATFQLIHPGLDGKFGEASIERIIKSGIGIDTKDLDNITNFSDNKELKSILP